MHLQSECFIFYSWILTMFIVVGKTFIFSQTFDSRGYYKDLGAIMLNHKRYSLLLPPLRHNHLSINPT